MFATYSYTHESADLRVADMYFDRLVSEYACGQFVTPMTGRNTSSSMGPGRGGGHGGGGGSLVLKDPGQSHISHIKNQNGVQATSGFEMCLFYRIPAPFLSFLFCFYFLFLLGANDSIKRFKLNTIKSLL